MPERKMLARVSRVEKLGETDLGRTSYEFDAIDQASMDTPMEKLAVHGHTQPFAVFRVVTTPRRFNAMQGVGVVPVEGDWIAFNTMPDVGRSTPSDRLRTWQCQLTETGYTELSRGYMLEPQLVFRASEPGPASLGARAPNSALTARAKAIGAFPKTAPSTPAAIAKLLRGFQVHQIRVRYVGQASFATLIDIDDEPLVHFDAGWPIGFNYRGTPQHRPDKIGAAAPVILSHWDWDHLHAYYQVRELQDRPWVVPVQNLSPGASLVAHQLLAKGFLHAATGPVSLGWGELATCSGVPGDSNHTGLALRVKLLSNRNMLLTGDAGYQFLPPALTAPPLHGLVVTHHGAHFDGPAPKPAKNRETAIISSGYRNVYRHPRTASIAKHTIKNWAIQRTSRTPSTQGGDRWLT